MICAVMEAANGVSYRLLEQGLLSRELQSTSAAGKKHLYSTIHYNSKHTMARQVGTLTYPCRLSGGGKETLFNMRKINECLRYILEKMTNTWKRFTGKPNGKKIHSWVVLYDFKYIYYKTNNYNGNTGRLYK